MKNPIPDSGGADDAARTGTAGKADAGDAHDAVHERVEPRLLEWLVCPVTKGPLVYDAAAQELISKSAYLAFPIRKGVAMLSVEAARHLDDE